MANAARPRTALAVPAAWRVWAALGAVYVIWGSTYLAIRVMVDGGVPPLLGAGARFALAGVLLLGVLGARRGWAAVAVERGPLVGAAAVGLLLAAGGNGLVTVAEQDVPSSLAALLVASVPLWVVVLRAMVARERTPPIALTGVAVGFAGVGLLLLPSARPEGATAAGVALVLVAAVSWATGSFLSPRLVLPADPLVSTGWQMLAGGLALVAGAVAAGEPGDVRASAVSASAALAFAYLVVAGSLVAYSAYAWLLQHAPLTQVSTYAYVNPLVAVLLGALVLDEALAPLTLAGAVLIVAAVALIVTRQSRVASRNPAR